MTDRMKQATLNAIPILISRVISKQPITYGELGKEIKYNAQNVGRVLGPIQDYCEEKNIPPLTSIVIRTDEKKPGYHYKQRYSSYSEDMEKSSKHDWDNEELIDAIKVKLYE